MIDLREEIEVKLKYAKNLYDNINENDNGYLKSYFLGTIQSYETILKCLENHNIITAPKTIKLSEIVSKLNEIFNDTEFSSEIYFNRKLNAIGEGEYDKDWFMNTWTPFIRFKENKISEIINLESERTKWLYTLWIAGTIIEDDLREE